MKIIFTLIFVLSINHLSAQNFRLNKYCENSKASFDVALVGNKKVRYQIVDFASLKVLKHKDEYTVSCILPDYSSKSAKSEIKKIAIQLKKLNPKFTEFTFFNSCEVYHIFLSSTSPTREKEKKLKNGYIGEFKS